MFKKSSQSPELKQTVSKKKVSGSPCKSKSKKTVSRSPKKTLSTYASPCKARARRKTVNDKKPQSKTKVCDTEQSVHMHM